MASKVMSIGANAQWEYIKPRLGGADWDCLRPLNVLRKDAAMGQDGQACTASAETSRNSFSVAPLAD